VQAITRETYKPHHFVFSHYPGEFTCVGHGQHRFSNGAKRFDKGTAALDASRPTVRCKDGL